MFIAVILFAIGGLLANYAGRFGDAIAKTNPQVTPKYDLYLDTIGYVNTSWYYMPDLMLVVLCIAAIEMYLQGFSALNFKGVIYELGVLHIIRAIACRLTVGYVSARYAITKGYIKGGIKGVANCYFSDLVVSGHTMTVSVIYYMVYDSCSNMYLLAIYTVLWVIAVTSNLFVGDHYSSDVFIGLVLSWLLHY